MVVYQYAGFVGEHLLTSTIDPNPSRCWKKVKSIHSVYYRMPHREAVNALKSDGVSVRRIGKIAIGNSTLGKYK